MVDNINFLLDVGQGRSQAIISYNQVLNYLEKKNQEDENLYKVRAITDHHGPLRKNDPNYNGSLYNVMVEWETGEITEEPLSIIAQDDPVTCAAYAKEHDLLHLPKWSKLKHIAKHQKTLLECYQSNQYKTRQEICNLSIWLSNSKRLQTCLGIGQVADGMMPPGRNWIKSMSNKFSLTMREPSMTPNQKGSKLHLKDTRKSKYTWSLLPNTMDIIKPG